MPSKYGPKVDAFYHSSIWKKARAMKIKKAHGVCELCGRKGTEIHHIEPLTEENVSDLRIAVGEDNLMLLCKSCHDSIRSGTMERCTFDSQGNVVSIAGTPPGRVLKKSSD